MFCLVDGVTCRSLDDIPDTQFLREWTLMLIEKALTKGPPRFLVKEPKGSSRIRETVLTI